MENAAQFAETVNKLFGEKLARARRVRNITQGKLAELVGVSRVTIANLERGRQNIQLHQVFTFGSALNVPASELIPTVPELPSTSSSSPDTLFLEIARARLNTVAGGDQ